MQQNPVFHLGFPKCASTFLQKQVFPNLKSYEYLSCRHELKAIIAKFFYELPADLSLGRIAGTRTVVSHERLLGFIQSPALFPDKEINAGILNIYRIFGDEVTVLVVIRRQDDLVRSRIRHKCAVFYSEDLVFLDYPVSKTLWGNARFTTRGGDYLSSLNFFSRLMPLVYLFGKDRVKILLYEDLKYDADRFFAGLSEALDEDISGLRDKADVWERVGPRKAPPRHPFLQKLNRHTGGAINRWLPQRDVDISERFAEGILDQFRDSNRKLSDFFGLDLERHGYF